MGKGIFISFEGCEGSGKTTQSKMLHEHLKSKSETIWTREIGGTNVSESIRDLMLHSEMSITTEILLVMAARYQHVADLIRPNLEKSINVICDRFIDSTICYQGLCSGGVGADKIIELHESVMGKFYPDITFFMDISPEEALQRAKSRGDNNKFEDKDLEFHTELYHNFKSLEQKFPERFIAINAQGTADEIHERVLQKL